MPEASADAQSMVGDDADILSYAVINDQNRGKSPWYLEPRGRWDDKSEALEAYTRVRNHLILFIRQTEANLRAFVTTSGRGPAPYRDLHQLMLISIAHSDRHISQIMQVKGNKGFQAN